jgi:hypothetical protein
VAQGPAEYDSLILTFGTDPVVVSAEFRLNYRRGTEPQGETVELLITQGPPDAVPPGTPIVRRPLTMDEFVSFASSPVINVEPANIELILVESQQGGIARKAARWKGQP